MPYLRRPDLSVFSRVSLHSFFSSTVPPYPFSNTSPIFIYVDSSIRSYVANTSVFFQRKPTHVNLSSLHGKDPPFKYRLPPYGVFTTCPRVSSEPNGRTMVIDTDVDSDADRDGDDGDLSEDDFSAFPV